MIVDYLCDLKADLYAITETWPTEKDAAFRTKLALDGYNVGTTFVKAEMVAAALGSYTVMHCDFRKLKLESERLLNFQNRSSAQLSHNFRLFIEFSHDITVAILVSQNNEKAAMLVSQSNPLGVALFCYANAFFCLNKNHFVNFTGTTFVFAAHV